MTSTTTQVDRHQELMDAAYNRWEGLNTHWSKAEFWAQLSPEERFAVFTGNFNQQVCNGGFRQWHDNGYAQPEVINYLITTLDSVGTPAMLAAASMLETFKHSKSTRQLDKLDSRYYKIDDLFLKECQQALLNGTWKRNAA